MKISDHADGCPCTLDGAARPPIDMNIKCSEKNNAIHSGHYVGLATGQCTYSL